MKVPTSSLVQRIISKNRGVAQRKSSADEERMWLCLGRSSTYDASDTLKREIETANHQEEDEGGEEYEMKVINENFSD